MALNMSGRYEESLVTSSSQCAHNMTTWDEQMYQLYTYFYLFLFIPGLLLNTFALWVLCRHISKKTKAAIFMINLSLADLAHILSLPLRIYYYFTHTWPFGHSICLFCFYLKFFNMYAAIAFLVCISVQRCVFLLNPFAARRWRQRYDLAISILVWVVVGVACSPFILMRNSTNSSTGVKTQSSVAHSVTYSLVVSTTLPPVDTTLTVRPASSTSKLTCFKDLPIRRLPVSTAITVMALAELFGFLIPLVAISYSSIRITRSLKQRQSEDQQNSTRHNSSAFLRLQSVTSTCQADRQPQKQTNSEKRRALRMVLSCTCLFLFCFAPYHINFLLYMMVSQDILSHCATRLAVQQFHPLSLCLASMSCCLNPLLYYFLTAEFRSHLTKRTFSFTSSAMSSPVSSPSYHPALNRMMSMESSLSDRE
ncbi:putative P2Y purinoceptor 10 [Thalassophryne amazonica]|uniref:putative P2Y purinoceptor 10 n=1 Tax=Thalassophryne amazonica TaxID=390379 RepID=UPI001470B6A4|nr:putative P2Y purinoceptor 10 [Thalassophryne amazonica]